jgi:serine/threonine protein phosphatase PrpC
MAGAVTPAGILLVAAVLTFAAAVGVSLLRLVRRRTPHARRSRHSIPRIKAAESPPRPRLVPSVPPGAGGEGDDYDWDVTQIQVAPIAAAAPPPTPGERKPSVFAHEAAELETGEESRVVVSYEDDADVDEGTGPAVRILMCAQGDSDRGHKRRMNEDSFLFLTEHALFAVADGMGGHAGGKVASNLAVDTLRDAFERGVFEGDVRSDKPVPRRGHELACALLSANQAVFTAGQADPALANMGTTAVVARFSANKQRLYLAHVGDSRCYRLRAGTFRQLTTDHTMSTLGMAGPRAKDLFRAIGIKPHVDIDLIVDKPHGDDIYLLCSDGLSKMVSDDEIRRILMDETDLEAAVYNLIEAANDNGGKDNVTVILVQVIERASNLFQRARGAPSPPAHGNR